MKPCMQINLGRMSYRQALELQKKALLARQQNRIADCLLIVEHDPVFTIGKSGDAQNLLVSNKLLQEKQIDCVAVERGGDITYHGPGQLVVYPIFSLVGCGGESGFGIADFIGQLELLMIELLKMFGVNGHDHPRNRGVWVGNAKVGFVGIAVKRYVTFHGIAVNISPDLDFFRMINPCGMKGVNISSVKELTGMHIPFAEAAGNAASVFQSRFGLSLEPMPLETFENFLEDRHCDQLLHT